MDKDTHTHTSDAGAVHSGNGPTPPLKKILVISPWASRWSLGSGAGVSDDYNFIDKFTKSGYELHFVAPHGDNPSELPFDNLYIHGYPDFFAATSKWPTGLKRLLWPALFNLIVTVAALRIARRVKPDFVLGHSHYSSFPGFVTKELMRLPSGVKLFGVMDLVHNEWPTWKYYFKNIEQIVALKFPHDVWLILDDGTKGREAALRHGVPESKIQWLPNGINLEWINQNYNERTYRDRLDVPADAVLILFLARLVQSKRPEMVLHAIPRTLQLASKQCVFVFAGDGPERGECEQLARTLGVEAVVRFAGAVPHNDVPQLMAASDIFVSTSSLTNAAIPTCEAMVCGLPAVAFDVGDTRNFVLDGDTGIVVKDGDVAGLAEAFACLAGDPGKRTRMSDRARQIAAERLTSWERRTNMELEIIDRIIDSR
ncbi:MAG: glycosyltransferase family 4 protein [Candidatus Latescibacterota bacterium]|nr:MAG: glycosyltransferase family 4 protein [Candidatus Latescibacterota bacterium]